LVAEGHSSKEIAELLSVSPTTIETHRAHLLQKLDVHNTAELVLYAVRRGKTACRKPGLPGRLFHDLRSSAARNFVRSGIPERVAMRLLRHKTRSIFDRYKTVSSGDLVDAAQKLDAVRPSRERGAR
jgi:integrase